MTPADQVEDAPHPRETTTLFGHVKARSVLTGALASERAHHAWLLAGPRGIGKATLAYHAAAGILGPDAARQVTNGSHPALWSLIRRPNDKTGKLSPKIIVDDVRAMERRLVQQSAPDGGWRVVIVDAAEDMNVNAANALLKTLEEPPARMLFLLVSHAPGRLLPTIRSRCRLLTMEPPEAEDSQRAIIAAAPMVEPAQAARLLALADAAPGEALRLRAQGGDALYAALVALLEPLPGRVERAALVALADRLSPRDQESAFAVWGRMLMLLTVRAARAAALGVMPEEAAPGEGALLRRLAPDALAASIWAAHVATLQAGLDRVFALNLDRRLFIIGAIRDMEAAAQRAAA